MEKIKIMNKLSRIMALSALCLPAMTLSAGTASAADDGIAYSLPSTSVRIEVEARQEHFYAGPYAKYAKKYLGVDARESDSESYIVTSVKLTPFVEADLTARYYLPAGKYAETLLSFTSQGLVSVSDAASGSTEWRFPSVAGSDFADKGVSSNLTSEETTLYRNVKSESAYNKVAVQQEMVVQKSLEYKARETAEMIFNLRKKRVQIVTGDTDATFSGEAMGAAVEEIARLEKEYMSMFVGYSEYSTQKMCYDIVPSKDNDSQVYVAFRLSDSKGLVPADDVSGKPYLIEFVPQEVSGAASTSSGRSVLYYRIPATCSVKLSDGAEVLLQSRMPVYQLGVTASYPITVK